MGISTECLEDQQTHSSVGGQRRSTLWESPVESYQLSWPLLSAHTISCDYRRQYTMRCSQAENIHEALGPLLESLCWIGLGTFERRGQQLKFLSFAYRGFLLIVFLTCFVIAEFKTTESVSLGSSVVQMVYMLRVYGNAGVVLLLLGLGHFVHGITHALIKRMITHDYAMMALDVTFDYRTFRRNSTIVFLLGFLAPSTDSSMRQINNDVSICLLRSVIWRWNNWSPVMVITITYFITEAIWMISSSTYKLAALRYVLSQYYPLIVSVFANTIFVVMIFSIARRFRKMNDLLKMIVRRQNGKKIIRKGTPRKNYIEPMTAKPAWTIDPYHGLNYGSSKKVDHTPSASLELLRRIRTLHRELCGIARALNRAYSLQFLSFTAITFSLITAHMYYLYVLYPNKTYLKPIVIFTILSWTFLYAGALLGVAATAEYCMNEVKATGNVIHEIITYDDAAMREEVHGFSLQLINQPLQFTACGFFPIDYTLVRNMGGSITTYLIILIQMSQPADLSTPGAPNNSTASYET